MSNPMHELIGEMPYHSIGHIPNSKLGPGDHHISEGQYARYMKLGDYRERIAVTEKLDGTCVGVVRDGYKMIAIQRNGHLCSESPYEMHHRFAEYVKNIEVCFSMILTDNGDRIMGEWVAQAHGIVYDKLPDLFFAFDAKLDGVWIDTLELRNRCATWGISTVPLVHYGMPLFPDYWPKLTKCSTFKIKGPAEGLVFRRELNGKRIDIAKWVRSDHVAGKYLPGTDNAETNEPIWHKTGWCL